MWRVFALALLSLAFEPQPLLLLCWNSCSYSPLLVSMPCFRSQLKALLGTVACGWYVSQPLIRWHHRCLLTSWSLSTDSSPQDKRCALFLDLSWCQAPSRCTRKLFVRTKSKITADVLVDFELIDKVLDRQALGSQDPVGRKGQYGRGLRD